MFKKIASQKCTYEENIKRSIKLKTLRQQWPKLHEMTEHTVFQPCCICLASQHFPIKPTCTKKTTLSYFPSTKKCLKFPSCKGRCSTKTSGFMINARAKWIFTFSEYVKVSDQLSLSSWRLKRRDDMTKHDHSIMNALEEYRIPVNFLTLCWNPWQISYIIKVPKKNGMFLDVFAILWQVKKKNDAAHLTFVHVYFFFSFRLLLFFRGRQRDSQRIRDS